MSDESLRAAYQARVAHSTPADRSGCPSPEALNGLAGANRSGDDRAQLAVLEHVMSCAACRPEYEVLRSVHRAELTEKPLAKSNRAFRLVSIAAALVLAAGIGGEAWRRSRDVTVRDAGVDNAGVDNADVVLVTPAANSPRPINGRFVWRSVAGTSAYQLEILDSTGTLIAQQTSADTTIQLSPPDSARVAALPVFDWMVVARRTDGNERRSALTRVR